MVSELFRAFQRFLEVFRGFQRFSVVFRGFSKALSQSAIFLSELGVVLPLIVLPLKTPATQRWLAPFFRRMSPDPPILAFFRFPIFVAFLGVFPSKEFRGSAKRETLAFLGVSLAFFQKSKGWRVREMRKLDIF